MVGADQHLGEEPHGEELDPHNDEERREEEDGAIAQGNSKEEALRREDEREQKADPGGEAVDIPIVVLVNRNSASGAEVLSGALRDHGRAVLIGEQTFGKGSVNHLRELSNGGALYVTIARWLTPNGEQIEGVGLVPDVPIAPSEEDLATGRDTQLFAAIDTLRAKVATAAARP